MTTNIFSTSIIGWVACASGITVIFAVLSLTLMFTVCMSFGAVNDVLNGVVGISGAVLAWMLYAEHRATSPSLSHVALAPAFVGAIFGIVGSILILYGFTDFLQFQSKGDSASSRAASGGVSALGFR
jgi:hypothetical protein